MEREKRAIQIDQAQDGQRVDTALAKVLELSRSVVADLLNAGEVLQGKKPLSKSDRVSAGDRLTVLMPAIYDPLELKETPIDTLEIIYDDDDVVVVNKPVGCAAHASPGWMGPTVVGALLARGYRISTTGPQERQGIVQRLDAGTSGLMLLAKHERSYISMKNQFRNRSIEKVYRTLIQGHIDPVEGSIDAPIGRHPREDYRFAVVADGKASITHYELIEYYQGASLLKVVLETGRTHQIRVHFNALRHPLVGDLAYGGDPVLAARLELKRPWLHAMELSFNQPSSDQRITLNAPLPDDLTRALALLAVK
ncbi:MAG: pseudouridine synthase [Actinobacteria bacterium BACL2 MAG-120820-bin50]|jgi:23S rRNA pseudouridine1911/1915/1917 synthase|uniref:Pseudouridine synthase n=3 Tax=ac1 cluster TaxID=1655545 RepID=A0A0R2QSE2_9ACTN|nr:MAG: pseudouridine synthase [Actinobacteria bacterium BACL2 MAG-121220-bin52]KRO44673.1 MAG: pseudouridine synthase [Actinobacteria bacterium BACL2 MAG-120813-bin23]KRO52997.1 MAG: pseudouridine synthase [Actinobacteria bacterium BACL2 MAG-120820-bin50]KRO74231.1 MAG: pseudouridine synthase [Actinobacteria bacterium BACL2 MAG-120920-bin34]MDP4615070.1 RluA family pseudouridine synthase [Candidatus Nanopelagicales bacterium]MDP4864086.1 RluA family pseudouridine synthase [Candidatus Nanopela